jgi:hypothetical protein
MRPTARFVSLLTLFLLPSYAIASVHDPGDVENASPLAGARSGGSNVVTAFSTDFESGLPPEMTAPGSVLDGVQGYAGLGVAGNQFGGSFLRYTSVPLYDTKLVLRNLPTHTSVSLGFLLGIIDSWDGTELFQVRVDDALLFNHWFQLAVGDSSDYIAPPGALLSRGHDLGFSGCCYYNRDRAYDLGADPVFQNIPHTADSLVVVWSLSAISGPAADQWQGGSDESWAIDNVSVTLTPPTEDVPGTAAPPGLELAGAQPNPSRDRRLHVQFALPTADPARLELFDVSGRRLAAREVGAMGPGRHALDMGERVRLDPGLYLLRLTQAGVSRTARAVVMQ